MFKEILSEFTCSGAFGEVVNALACYVLVAVGTCVVLINDYSAGVGFNS